MRDQELLQKLIYGVSMVCVAASLCGMSPSYGWTARVPMIGIHTT